MSMICAVLIEHSNTKDGAHAARRSGQTHAGPDAEHGHGGRLGVSHPAVFQGRPDGDRQLGLAGLVTARDQTRACGPMRMPSHPSGAVGAGQVSDLLELGRTPNAAIATLLPIRRDGVQG